MHGVQPHYHDLVSLAAARGRWMIRLNVTLDQHVHEDNANHLVLQIFAWAVHSFHISPGVLQHVETPNNGYTLYTRIYTLAIALQIVPLVEKHTSVFAAPEDVDYIGHGSRTVHLPHL